MKRDHQHSEEQQNVAASHQQQGAQEFADSDELLRFDMAQTIVPREVAQRLQKSLGEAPAPSAWWKKLLGL